MKYKADYASFFAEQIKKAFGYSDAAKIIGRLRMEVIDPLSKMCVVRNNPPEVVALKQKIESGCADITQVLSGNEPQLSAEETSSPRFGG
jgi:hypothetical protein